jgi:ferredoxin-NADP reductase
VITFNRQPPDGCTGHRGRNDSTLIAEAGVHGGIVFICGSNPFVDAAADHALGAGLRPGADPHRGLRAYLLSETV